MLANVPAIVGGEFRRPSVTRAHAGGKGGGNTSVPATTRRNFKIGDVR